ncbi:hypothetical protein TSUD_367330 [Trifolium subterraneum]|uniref:Uncharacterized protein n=1 Tax=Trifolium subterraneum TaxID=3900 RepID=A0A2Z6P438_TRISU|nr:hypothetical protein TSUD_367330 [Trifolium subterraneum]
MDVISIRPLSFPYGYNVNHKQSDEFEILAKIHPEKYKIFDAASPTKSIDSSLPFQNLDQEYKDDKYLEYRLWQDVFKRLGAIVYSIWGGTNTSLALEQFMLDFVDQTDFL